MVAASTGTMPASLGDFAQTDRDGWATLNQILQAA
jgi:hypothetical protein